LKIADILDSPSAYSKRSPADTHCRPHRRKIACTDSQKTPFNFQNITKMAQSILFCSDYHEIEKIAW